MASPLHLFWDSCVFIRYLTGDESFAHYDHICQFIDDAKAGRARIYYSTLALAEIRPRHIRAGKYGSAQEMIADFGASFLPIEATTNIFLWASLLKDAQAVNPGDPKMPPEKVRVVGTPDAIHLASCLFARDVLGVNDIVFHTLDEGKGPSWEGRCIPLLGYESWYPIGNRSALVEKVCGLHRSYPIHPQPTLNGIIPRGRNIDLGSSDPAGQA